LAADLTHPLPLRQFKSLTLDPFQARALEALDAGRSVLVAAPTGAGKTLVAEYAVEQALARGDQVVYTAPIKALSNQKFRDFALAYGEAVGIKTGDVTINPDAPIVLMTTEIFRNTIFESPGALDRVRTAILDEIHYLDDIERGTVWEESLIFAPKHIRVVCLSATVPNAAELARWIADVRGGPVELIEELQRPVPLRHWLYVPGEGVMDLKAYAASAARPRATLRERPAHGRRAGPGADGRWRADLIRRLHEQDRLPAIYFVFNRSGCEQYAARQARPLLSPRESDRLLVEFDRLVARFGLAGSGDAAALRTVVARGTAYHHAGLLPTIKEVIERLFTTGLIKLLFATETFAVGVNMPARSVVFDTIEKFDGVRRIPIKTREHHQMSGRAGRRGIDTVGDVYTVLADGRPDPRIVHEVLFGRIEPIRSQFSLSYATILSLVRRLGRRVTEACARSFAFASVAGRGRTRRFYEERVRQVEQRLQILRIVGAIEGDRLTAKGEFAATIHGYELPVTELVFRRLLEPMSEHELAVIFTALVYEPKRAHWHAPARIPSLKAMRRAVRRVGRDILALERPRGIDEPTKEAEFRIAAAVWAWSHGAGFDDLAAATSMAPGDLIRCLRMAIQLMRQTASRLEPADPLGRRLRRAVDRINRDEVDAERQLRMGVEIA
jgi:superfamily II RNA helicase